MTNLYFDIETIPDQREGALVRIFADVTAPARYTKQDSIDKWMHDNAQAEAEEQYLKTSLHGISGEIVSIAWAFDDGEIQGHIRRPGGPIRQPGEYEEELIRTFFWEVENETKPGEGSYPNLGWIGHNIIDFDLRYLKQRCMVNQIKPPFIIPADARHGSRDVFDTMRAWAGFRGYVSQAALCEVLGIEGKGDMEGKDVWPAYQAGEFDKILAYNKNDVRIVRELYRRMT